MAGRLRSFLGVCAASAYLAVMALTSCGGGTEEAEPCDNKFIKGKCGTKCLTDSDCSEGTYCKAGKCTADCAPPGSKCGDGKVCDARGHCIPSLNLDGGGGSGDGGGDGCVKGNIEYAPQTPTVVLLVDQSGSMTEDFGGAGTRWNVLHDALVNPTTGIVATLESQVRFGLTLYTSHEGNQGPVCPELLTVPPAINNFAAIKATYDPAQPEDETPTGESINGVVQLLTQYNEPGPKAIVLATDGEPDTCAEPNPQNGQATAVAAAQAAFAANIQLYIIAVGDQVSAGHQQDMANAGVGLPIGGAQNAPYYQALDQTALIQAFKDIINGVRPCTIDLAGSLDPSQAGKGTVFLDGQPLGFGDPNGWQLKSPKEIELLGSACAAIKEGTHTLTFDFPCGAYTPPPPPQ